MSHTTKIENGVVVGNTYDKYASKNPVVLWMMKQFMTSFSELAKASKASQAHEIGCGEGHLTLALAQMGFNCRACDISQLMVQTAQKNTLAEGFSVPIEKKEISELRPEKDSAELIVCCEVLEHVPKPAEALKMLSQLAKPYALLSVPREPLWRILNMARGKYLRDLGNTPGHLNHWSQNSFIEFVSERFEILELRDPLPWSMLLCKSK